MAQKIDLPVRIFAPAKINLFLHITGKTNKNYHQLQSLICFSNIGDTVEIKTSPSFALNIEGSFAALLADEKTEHNLVYRAAKLLAAHFKKKLNLSITLHKAIPVGAGLGGGSADAAATIKGLLKFWQVKISAEELHDILPQLGADVPACYYEKTAFVEGIGEIITPLPAIRHLPAVIIYPNVLCPTERVFKNYHSPFHSPITAIPDLTHEKNFNDFIKQQKNDLTPSAQEQFPVIKDVLDHLKRAPDCKIARMSGSGSACFGIFKSKDDADNAARQIQKEKPDWWVRPVLLG